MSKQLVSVALIGLVAMIETGCGPNKADETPTRPGTPEVQTVNPTLRTLQRTIEQPARIQASERTPLYSKLSAYVDCIHVELGTPVQEGEWLAELRVPDMDQELVQKDLQVQQTRLEIKQTETALAVAKANRKTSQSLVQEARANHKKAESACQYWHSEADKMVSLVRDKVIDLQSRDETLHQLRTAEAACEEARARISSAEAAAEESGAREAKAEADLQVAENRLKLAQADLLHMQALLSYAQITAPFDGVISDRSVDTGHFVQPPSGAAGNAVPLFVIERTDWVRVFVDVPEMDAVRVRQGLPAHVRVQALNDEEFPGQVTGSSWSVASGQRTLRTEIDLPNPEGRLRPGTYAHAVIEVEQLDALTLPSAAIVTRDGQTFCYCVQDGKAVRTQVRIGMRQGDLVEVLKKQQPPARAGEKPRWVNFTGKEQVIVTNPGELIDGQPISASSGP